MPSGETFYINYTKLRPSSLEAVESLEQLRILENGYKIKVVVSRFDSIGVDTAQDLKKVAKIIKRQSE